MKEKSKSSSKKVSSETLSKGLTLGMSATALAGSIIMFSEEAKADPAADSMRTYWSNSYPCGWYPSNCFPTVTV